MLSELRSLKDKLEFIRLKRVGQQQMKYSVLDKSVGSGHTLQVGILLSTIFLEVSLEKKVTKL